LLGKGLLKSIIVCLYYYNSVVMSVKHRIQVLLTAEQIQLIQKLKPILGNTDSEVIRNIVLAWLAEKSLISSFIKKTWEDKNENN